jgi:hypothetical protein
LWTAVHSLWTHLWGDVDRLVGDTPGTLAPPPLTSDYGRAHGVDEKN